MFFARPSSPRPHERAQANAVQQVLRPANQTQEQMLTEMRVMRQEQRAMREETRQLQTQVGIHTRHTARALQEEAIDRQEAIARQKATGT